MSAGGGFLLTVDTQMCYGDTVPSQLDAVFNVTFREGYYKTYEYIVNYDHPITEGLTQAMIFNDFLLWDAAIESWPEGAALLIDPPYREEPPDNSTLLVNGEIVLNETYYADGGKGRDWRWRESREPP